MTTYVWSSMTTGQSLTFNNATDLVVFDSAGSGANAKVTQGPAITSIAFGGKTLLFQNSMLNGTIYTDPGNHGFLLSDGSVLGLNMNGVTDRTTLFTLSPLNDQYVSLSAGGSGSEENIDAGAGADILTMGDDNDTAQGGDGDDLINGNKGFDDLDGGNGNDTIFGGQGDDFITDTGAVNPVQSSNDSINGNYGNDFIDGGAGDDTLFGGQNQDLVFGGDGNDSLSGDIGDDVLDGGNGNDTLLGMDGNDQIFDSGLDSSDDSIDGGSGDDELDGGEGADTVFGGQGNDLITHDSFQGSSSLSGDDGDDVIDAFDGGGSDTISGGAGNDSIDAPDIGDDSVNGDAGDDIILGEFGNDTVVGGDGNDILLGDDFGFGDGNDSISGGAGDDVIGPAGGVDTLSGGAGNDSFAFEWEASPYTLDSSSVDVILDFKTGQDKLFIEQDFVGAPTSFNKMGVNFASYDAARQAAQNAMVTHGVVVGQVGADLYVFVDGDGDGVLDNPFADQVIKLAGLGYSGLNQADVTNASPLPA